MQKDKYMDPFLPNNYKAPEGNYMKLQDGENTFRVLSSAIVGYEYWNTEDKPVRSRTPFTSTPVDIKKRDGKITPIKHFWAFVVYNYSAEKRQILEITQSGIQGAIKALVENKKWGDPKKFDITINKKGSGLETEYSVMPNPHSDLIVALPESAVRLEALYTGDDPFSGGETAINDTDTHTPKQPGDEGYVDVNDVPPDFLKP